MLLDEVERRLGAVGGKVQVLTRIWTLFGLQPTVAGLGHGGAENSELNSLRLCQCPIFLDLVQTLADRGVVWVIDVDVSPWSWHFRASHLVAVSWVHATKWNVHSLLHQQSALDIVTFLFVGEVGAWPWGLLIRLLSEGSSNVVPPVINSVSCAIELISSGTLSKAGLIGCRIIGIQGTHCLCKNPSVVAGSRVLSFAFLCVFTVGHFGKEGACVALGVELSFRLFIDCFVLARAWVLLVRQPSIFNVYRRFKEFPLVF